MRIETADCYRQQPNRALQPTAEYRAAAAERERWAGPSRDAAVIPSRYVWFTSGTPRAGGTCKDPHDMREKDEVAIRALEEAYDSAWNAGDVTSLVAVLTQDVVVVNPIGKRAQGQAEVGRALGEFLRGPGKGSRHNSVVLGIEFIGDDVAIVDGEATLEGTTGISAANATPLVHRFTDVVVKRAGVWKVAHVRAYVLLQSSPP